MLSKLAVKQHDIKDCGAASLLSIIKYYHGYVPINKIREDCSISKNGITAYNLIFAAKKYGFDAYGTKATKEDLFSKNTLFPCIAYLELKNGLKHYVVIYEIKPKHIIIMDPSCGIKKIAKTEFLAIWQNVLIILYPHTTIVKYEQSNKLFDLFMEILSSEKKLIITLFITSLFLTILSIISSFYMKLVINNIASNLKGLIYLIIGIFFIISVIKIILNYLRNYYENYLNKDIDVKIIIPFLQHIFKLPSKAISNYTTGEISTRVSELNNIKNLFSNMFVTLVLNLLLALASCFVLFKISQKLFGVLLIVIFVYVLISLLFVKPIIKKVRESIDCETAFNSVLLSHLKSFATIKTSNNYAFFQSKLEKYTVSFLKNNFKFNNFVNIYNFLNNFIIEIGIFITNSLGILLILNNNLNLIDLVTFDSLYLYLIDPIKEIVNLIPKYFYIQNTFTKINEFILLEEEKLDKNSDSFSNGEIIFQNISFTYNSLNYPIKNFNMKISKGEKLMIMGPSGSGKSTIFKLLYRLYLPCDGSISINKINILDMNLNLLRENISYVSQEEKLFFDTIKNNLTLGEDYSLSKLNDIISICQLNTILDKKQMRLESFLIDDGNNLSGGEKQRIILARALLKDSPIILLDEALSEVELSDAEIIMNNIIKYFASKTIICISHIKLNSPFNRVVSVSDYA